MHIIAMYVQALTMQLHVPLGPSRMAVLIPNIVTIPQGPLGHLHRCLTLIGLWQLLPHKFAAMPRFLFALLGMFVKSQLFSAFILQLLGPVS